MTPLKQGSQENVLGEVTELKLASGLTLSYQLHPLLTSSPTETQIYTLKLPRQSSVTAIQQSCKQVKKGKH